MPSVTVYITIIKSYKIVFTLKLKNKFLKYLQKKKIMTFCITGLQHIYVHIVKCAYRAYRNPLKSSAELKT